VFFERENYLDFLHGIKKYLFEHVEILAYCLMPTHYHVLVRVKQQTSEFFKNSEVWGIESITAFSLMCLHNTCLSSYIVNF
jgi:REP element-mobilizing transposase RayT